ncbi:MAG TPA: hypothetical protein VFX16_32600 [Pseudonocardiaceae bacterium]|nr:hypothetical protein [Pseudonocardiaceae bacterium]
MLRGRDVELVCGACEAVFAGVHVRSLARGMDVRSLVTFSALLPRAGYSVNEEARQRLARAEVHGTRVEIESARGVVSYLRECSGDIVYDLTCRCLRRYVRTSSEFFREIGAARGRWLTLSPGTASWPPPG